MQTEASNIAQKTDVEKLPSLPHVLLPLLAICNDESLSFELMADILRKDPSLSLKVMSACALLINERGSTRTAEQTLKQLGINTLKSIAITSATQQFFSRNNAERTEFIKQHWQHSLLCANIAEAIATRLNYAQAGDAYTAGLLHDIGQLALENSFPEKYTSTFAELSEEGNFHNLEYEAFETTHHQVGAELLRRHGASPFVVDAVLYHHEPLDTILDAHPLVKIVHLANRLSSNTFKQEDSAVFEEAGTLFKIERAELFELLEQARGRVAADAGRFEIDLVTDGVDDETARQIAAGEEFKQLQLAEQIRNIAMLDGVHQHLSRIKGDKQLLQAVEQHVGILFSVSSCILFLYDAGKDRLRALASEKLPAQLDEFSIPLDAGRSLVADALLQKQALHSFENTERLPSVIDRQLVGLTGHAGVIVLPLIMNNAAVGSLVLGVDKLQFDVMWKQHSLLVQFASEIARTISATRDVDSTVLRQQKRDAGELLEARVREVVHEVRNPLSIMNNYLEILGYKLEAEHPAQADLNTIKSEIQRVSSILQRLSQAQPSADESSMVDINTMIADLTLVFQTSICAANDIDITLDLDDSIAPIMSNINALKQIYTNLVKNAAEALPANGQIMVYTQDHVNVDGKEHIEICVSDDGPGIDTEILPRLFSPIETQKGGEHAGLGLTIVKNLVNELHGSISCRSSDKGTSFHILLPK